MIGDGMGAENGEMGRMGVSGTLFIIDSQQRRNMKLRRTLGVAATHFQHEPFCSPFAIHCNPQNLPFHQNLL